MKVTKVIFLLLALVATTTTVSSLRIPSTIRSKYTNKLDKLKNTAASSASIPVSAVRSKRTHEFDKLKSIHLNTVAKARDALKAVYENVVGMDYGDAVNSLKKYTPASTKFYSIEQGKPAMEGYVSTRMQIYVDENGKVVETPKFG